jgi:hypothetical protein
MRPQGFYRAVLGLVMFRNLPVGIPYFPVLPIKDTLAFYYDSNF